LNDAIESPRAWLEQLLQQAGSAITEYLPSLLGALGILLLGWLVAGVLRWLVLRFGKGLDALLAALQRRTGREPVGFRWAFSHIVASLAFWMALLYAVIGASETLGLPALASWLRELIGYLPRILISGLILFIGYLLSAGIRDVIVTLATSAGFQHALSLGRLVAGLVVAFTLLLALAQLGLDVTLFENIITIAAGAIFGSAALAFGIGAGDSVRNIMAAHYVRKTYQTGQRVRVQGFEGEILELTPVAVVVETDEGSAVVPARVFLEQVALVRDEEDEEEDGA
jgi:small-conductance mechanosensitive channel